jgi:DNA-binding IclR family transcriptional regulator
MARGNPVQVIGKAGLILDALAAQGELGAGRLAELVGEPRSSVYRLLASLQRIDLVEPGTRRGTYRLGLKLFRLGSAVLARFDVREAALPVLERLHRETEETVFLSVRRGWEAVCIERLDGRWVQSMAVGVGGSLPLHVGAASRVLLAFEPREVWEEYVARGELAVFTPRTLATRESLFAALGETLRSGCATSDEDVVLGIAAVGAPVFDHRGGVCAAISMSGLKSVILGANAERSRRTIRAAAAEISHALGYAAGMGADTVRGVA